MIWLALLCLLVEVCFCANFNKKFNNVADDDEFRAIDVAELATHLYGTELILLENHYQKKRSYKFEDFFWTGSGDGSGEEENTIYPEYSTITKTVISTIYLDTATTSASNQSNITKCSYNCEAPTTPNAGEISPTPTLSPLLPTGEEDHLDADKQFWLLTVLKSDGSDPVITDLKNSLAKLYKTAFQRQQEHHLGIKRTKRAAPPQPVNVYIHNVEKIKKNDGEENFQVVYHVAVSGKPVQAVTAAKDMTLVSDDEVQKELGYPFLIKAEPYIKGPTTQASLSKSKNTWVFIGGSILGLLLLLLILAFVLLGLTKCKRAPQTTGLENRRQIFERGAGVENKGFIPTDTNIEELRNSPTYIDYRSQNHPASQVRKSVTARPTSSISTASSSSGSLDISPLMPIKKHKTPPKKPPRPKAAINKTVPLNVKKIPTEFFDSDSSRHDSPDTIFIDNYDPGVVSPKSYLSMPSVKSFPRGNMPEPLNKVLEPVSVLHLDMQEDEVDGTFNTTTHHLYRHASVGTIGDPGVIGPIVWNLHCQRLQQGVSMDEGIDDLKVENNVSRMRKRFHNLLDDTFSLFGSRRESPVPQNDPKPIPVEVKSHSAANTRPKEDNDVQPQVKVRPKTSDTRQITQSPSKMGPKGAWFSAAPSPLIRPLSAGPIAAPRVNVDHVLAQGQFKPNDPAIPLIAAIKNEIERCSLPGSTADLRE